MKIERSSMAALFLGLQSDLTICKRHLKPRHSSYWDRAYVRTLFALADGMLFSLRQILIAEAQAGTIDLPVEYRQIMSEIANGIDQNGRVEKRPSFLRFLPGLRFTIACICQVLVMNEYAAGAFSNPGWEAFKQAVKLRDRLTHPKNPSELIVQSRDLAIAQKAEEWFLSLMAGIIEPLEKKDRAARP